METTQQARPRQNPFSAALCLTLLASSSTLFAPNAAQSADLPSGKSAPVAYVRICDAYGSGFFTLPGSDTCIRIGGYVRAEYQYTPSQSPTRNSNLTDFRPRQPSDDEKSEGQLQPRERGFDGRLEVL